ncbi:unnamed protein product [Phyllotreta striolata]|uniref:Uncharacterized protein n=1 Tax=Phyllotreta striolata TaxID=444603 RepID=A0A9N9XT02_PHYSR|nr:unnamed protein product [Phyllotreta striolata]
MNYEDILTGDYSNVLSTFKEEHCARFNNCINENTENRINGFKSMIDKCKDAVEKYTESANASNAIANCANNLKNQKELCNVSKKFLNSLIQKKEAIELQDDIESEQKSEKSKYNEILQLYENYFDFTVTNSSEDEDKLTAHIKFKYNGGTEPVTVVLDRNERKVLEVEINGTSKKFTGDDNTFNFLNNLRE